jgi:hypothetical protein
MIQTNTLRHLQCNIGCSLREYLEGWDDNYKKNVSQISLFYSKKTIQYSIAKYVEEFFQ